MAKAYTWLIFISHHTAVYLSVGWRGSRHKKCFLDLTIYTIAPLLAESYVDESFGASVIFPHVLHQPNVLRVKHDGPCQPLVLSANATCRKKKP